MKKYSWIAKWAFLTLVLAAGCFLVPVLADAAPATAVPTAACSLTPPCISRPLLAATPSCTRSTEFSWYATPTSDLALASSLTVIPLDHNDRNNRCNEIRSQCWRYCQEKQQSFRCIEDCMRSSGCQ